MPYVVGAAVSTFSLVNHVWILSVLLYCKLDPEVLMATIMVGTGGLVL